MKREALVQYSIVIVYISLEFIHTTYLASTSVNTAKIMTQREEERRMKKEQEKRFW